MTSQVTPGPAVVTGGAGAIGSVLVAELLRRGQAVRVLDNLSSGRRESLGAALTDPYFQFHVADLREADATRSLLQGAEDVWHLAANPDIRLGTSDPRVDFEHGTLATFHVLDAARRNDLKRVFFSSSSVVYGYPTVFPTPEEYGPLLPQSLYGASKLAGEAQISAFCACYGLKGYLFRFANIIGPTMTHGVIFDFFEKIKRDPTRLEVLGDGRQAKSYLRTEECVAAMLWVADRAKDPVNVFNLGAEDRASVREIAEAVVLAYGGTARIEYTGGDRGWTGDIPQQLLAVDRVARLGWRAKLTSREAVEQTIREIAALRGL